MTPNSEMIWSYESFQTYHYNCLAIYLIVILGEITEDLPFLLVKITVAIKIQKMWKYSIFIFLLVFVHWIE